jgi:MinD-like ATPase involved in chromosome partitioning or flagellar assembly
LTDVPGVEYIGGVEGSVTDILPRLISGVLDVQELVSACKVIDNHYILSGLNSYIDVPPYSIENIKSLISMASAYFDYVIIDAGYSASLMAIAAMSVSEHVFVITTNSANAAIRYELQYRQVYGNVPEIRKERFKLITNMEDKDMLGSGRTVKAYGLQSIATVRKVENAVGIRAEYEGELIYNLDAAPGYRRDMDALTGAIFTEIGAIQANTKKTERRGLFGRRAAE